MKLPPNDATGWQPQFTKIISEMKAAHCNKITVEVNVNPSLGDDLRVASLKARYPLRVRSTTRCRRSSECDWL